MRDNTAIGGRRRNARRGSGWLFLLLCVLVFVSACSGSSTPTPTPGSLDAVELATLQNMRDNGFDASAQNDGAPGGLSNDWLYGTHPVETYIDAATGKPWPLGDSHRAHDPLVDIRYLHALWMYKNVHSADTEFDGEIQRYTPIVKAEFANTHDLRGYLFDTLIDLARLSGDVWYRNTAQQLAASYSKAITAEGGVPIPYKTNIVALGHYRVDYTLELGCALIEAGTLFLMPQWVTQGNAAVNFVYAHAYISSKHAFTSEMANVLLPDGAINPHETFFSASDDAQEYNGDEVRMAEVGLEALSLLHVYSVAHDATFLHRATDLLDGFTAQNNTLGMWDAQNLGYFDKATFPGAGQADAGQPQIVTNKKESGRQLVMLEAFTVANTFTNNRYADMELLMLDVVVNHAYYAPGHGFLYETQANWQPLPLRSGSTVIGQQNWVTAEAMGIALEAMLSTQEKNPW